MKLEAHYEGEKIAPETVQEALKHHLSRDVENPSLPTRASLPRSISELISPVKFGSFGFHLDATLLEYYARDLGISSDDPKVLEMRYWTPRSFGADPTLSITFFGRNLTGYGDHPFTIRLNSDSSGVGDELFLLRLWQERFIQSGKRPTKIASSGVAERAEGLSKDLDRAMANLPESQEGYAKQIQAAEERLNFLGAKGSVGHIRTFQDFIGQGLDGLPIKLNLLEINNFGEFTTSYSPDVVCRVARFPTLDTEDAMRILQNHEIKRIKIT